MRWKVLATGEEMLGLRLDWPALEGLREKEKEPWSIRDAKPF